MKIKFLSYCFAAAAALSMASCSDDIAGSIDGPDSPGNKPAYDGQYLYMSFGVNFSDGVLGRSSTNTGDDDDYGSSTDGMEYSSVEEYDVRTAIVVLAKMGTYDYLGHAEVTGILTSDRNEGTGNGTPNSTDDYFSFSTIGRFKYSTIASLYDEDGNLKDDYKNGVNVFVYCNPTGDLLSRFENTDFESDPTSWINWQGTVEQEPSLPGYTPTITNSIWAPRSFLMTNAKPAYAELPAKLANWDEYSQEEPYNLSNKNKNDDPDNSEQSGLAWGKQRGPIYVERAVARLDFKPDWDHLTNIKADWVSQEGAEWRYQILGGLSSSMHDGTSDTGDGEGTSFNFIDVQLTRMALVNMSKNFFFLRRVSPTGLEASSTVMGVERSTNYIVDTDAAIKQALNGYNVGNASTGFNFPLFTTAEFTNNPDLSREYGYFYNGWFTDNISDIYSNGKYDNSGTTDPKKRYNVWRYITENAIPQDEAGGTSRQVVVQSTGVVIKGLILPGEDIDESFEYQDAASAAAQGGAARAGEPSSSATSYIRYIPEEVVNALLASKYHLPQYGTGSHESTNTQWMPTPGASMSEKDAELNANSMNRFSFDYPTLYVFQGNIYAGFKTLVSAAQTYDGIGGLMYNSVNSTLGYWWANLDDLKLDSTNDGIATFKRYTSNAEAPSADGDWMQLNVERYNKIVNGFTSGEPILAEIPIGDTPSRFKIEFNEKSRIFRELLTTGSEASRFTLYDASYEEEDRGGAGWGYYCYYFWWFKHNDNGIDGRMGPMEFATVRNNVYKLSVTKISSLGHSLNTLNDPDPLNPETPDEEDKVYIDVDMKVVPWVVRRNSAQF